MAGNDQISKLKNSSQILRERHAYHEQHPEKIKKNTYDHMKESINRIDFACTLLAKGMYRCSVGKFKTHLRPCGGARSDGQGC